MVAAACLLYLAARLGWRSIGWSRHGDGTLALMTFVTAGLSAWLGLACGARALSKRVHGEPGAGLACASLAALGLSALCSWALAKLSNFIW
jgi:hypothetical protein